MIKSLIKKDGNLYKLISSLENHNSISVFGLTINEQISLFNDMEDFILYVVPTHQRAIEIKEMFDDLNKRTEVLSESFFCVHEDIKNAAHEKYYKTLYRLLNNEIDVLIVTPNILLNKLYNNNLLINNSISLVTKERYSLQLLAEKLTEMNYKRVSSVEEHASFSIRGDIVDIFPINSKTPFRISFFDDEIEFIKPFNVISQVSFGSEINTLEIMGNVNFKIYEEELKIAKKAITLEINKINQEEQVHLKQVYNSIFELNKLKTTWLNVFNSNINASLFSYLPDYSYVVFDEPKLVLDEISLFLKEKNIEINDLINNGKLLKQHKEFYFKPDEIFNFKENFGLVTFGSITTSNRIFSPKKVFNIKAGALMNYLFNKNLLIHDIKHFHMQNFTQAIFVKDDEFANFLKQKLLGENIESIISKTRNNLILNSVNLIVKSDNTTFCIPEEKLLVVGANKIFKKVVKENLNNDNASSLIDTLPGVGDYVVHQTHGIGKCVALEKITINNIVKDYIVLEYKGADKLFLPVENIDTITKYLGGDSSPTLNKLGGAEFYKIKQKVKTELKETAFSLTELYAKRINSEGIAFPSDDEFQEVFENDFIYTETPDQLKAINDVKSDMESGKIMDRLICGDVGYGKTEVALRAAFKAVNAGYQVAVLCPTTILSQQHYNTFMSRMQSYGVNIEVLNRFKTPSEQKKVIQNVNDGVVDIVIGTHALLNKNLTFKNLGLLVLDEEQKFGVEHKEKIKNLKSYIDVLTLSATPIPRSLHMALVGIRDVSIIETPPPLKLPVVTSVVEESDDLIKRAIMFELNRNGQVLIVFNNVYNIYNFHAKIKSFVSENVKVGVAHGQMTEKELENEIYKLYNGETQILVSTTLIENGIDLPSANTLIVVNSQNLGLSQLYQLKGRVGRGTVQAYAYFTYDNSKSLNENAVKRLEAISEFTSLGDGYKIAMRDLEIRGAGNVLGVKQHGHLQRVGYSMYVNLLKEAIGELKGEKVNIEYEPRIETDFSANLPNYYISSTSQRVSVYSKLSKLTSVEELSQFKAEIEEVYGEMPEDLNNLCYVAIIKNLAKKYPIKKITLKLKESKIEFLKADEMVNNLIINIIEKYNNSSVLNDTGLPIIVLNNFINYKIALNLFIDLLK